MAALASSGSAGVRWRGDYETGDFSQWDCGVQEKVAGRASIVTSPVRQGKYAARYEVRPGDTNVAGSGNGERTEALSCRSPQDGEEQWWGWSTMFASDFSASKSTWNSFTQWHNSGTSGGTLGFVVVGKELRFQSFGGNPSSPAFRSCKIADRTNGKWYDFVFHVKWSSSANVGFAEVWVNGTKVVELMNTPTLYTGQGVYPKQGYYRQGQPNVGVIYYDGMRQGTSFADVAPGPRRSAQATRPGAGTRGCLPAGPRVMVAPMIKGIAKPGRFLTATQGRWSPAPTTIRYQWQLSHDGSIWSDIRGAIGRSVVLPATYSGTRARVRVTVTASNAVGSGTAASAPLGKGRVARSPAPRPTGSASIVQSIHAGQTLRGTIVWRAVPAMPVKQIDFAMDGNKINHIDTTAPYECTVETTKLSNGEHTLGLSVTLLDGTVVWRPYQIGTVTIDNRKG